MKNAKYTLFAALAYIALIGALAVTSARPVSGQKGGPPGPDVRVVNTTAEPVPVTLQGTGKFTGDVNVVNTPSVNIANSPIVKVDTSTPLVVQEVGQVQKQFTQAHSGFMLFKGSGTTVALYTVPAGKRLIIQHASGEAQVDPGKPVRFLLLVHDGSLLAHREFMVSTFQGKSGILDEFTTNQETICAAEEGQVVSLGVDTEGTSDGLVAGSISGYLTDK